MASHEHFYEYIPTKEWRQTPGFFLRAVAGAGRALVTRARNLFRRTKPETHVLMPTNVFEIEDLTSFEHALRGREAYFND